MGATENSGFNSEVQRNLGLDFVTKQHKNFKQFTQLSVSDMLTRVNFPIAYLRYGAGPRYGGLIRYVTALCNGSASAVCLFVRLTYSGTVLKWLKPPINSWSGQ